MDLTEGGKAIFRLQVTWVQTVQLFEGNGFPSGEGRLPLQRRRPGSWAERPREGNR